MGAWVENKKYTLTVHYRNVTDEEVQDRIKREAFKIIESNGWRPSHGHKNVEAKPPIDWNKGTFNCLLRLQILKPFCCLHISNCIVHRQSGIIRLGKTIQERLGE